MMFLKSPISQNEIGLKPLYSRAFGDRVRILILPPQEKRARKSQGKSQPGDPTTQTKAKPSQAKTRKPATRDQEPREPAQRANQEAAKRENLDFSFFSPRNINPISPRSGIPY